MGHFGLNKVFVFNGIVTMFDDFYIGYSGVLALLQLTTGWLLLNINFPRTFSPWRSAD